MSGFDRDKKEWSRVVQSTSKVRKDVCFKVCDLRNAGNSPQVEENIFAHKKLLAAVSPVFKAQFFPEDSHDEEREVSLDFRESCERFISNNSDGYDVIDISDTSVEAVKLLIEYIYGSDIEWSVVTSLGCVFDIFVLASKFEIRDLIDISGREVRNLTRSDVIEIYGALNIARMVCVDKPFAGPILDHVISACADSLFSRVRNAKELQSLARSVTKDPKNCRAFCTLLAYKKDLVLASSSEPNNSRSEQHEPQKDHFYTNYRAGPSPNTAVEMDQSCPKQQNVVCFEGSSEKFCRTPTLTTEAQNGFSGTSQDSPNLLDDQELYSAECSQTLVSSSTGNFSNLPTSVTSDPGLSSSIIPLGLDKPFDFPSDKADLETSERKDFFNFQREDSWLGKGKVLPVQISPIRMFEDDVMQKKYLNGTEDIFQASVRERTEFEYVCGNSTCRAKMANLGNWKRHMMKVHLLPDFKFDRTLLKKKKSKTSSEIDPFDFVIPLEVDASEKFRGNYPCFVFECEFVGGSRKESSVHMGRCHGGVVKGASSDLVVSSSEQEYKSNQLTFSSEQTEVSMDETANFPKFQFSKPYPISLFDGYEPQINNLFTTAQKTYSFSNCLDVFQTHQNCQESDIADNSSAITEVRMCWSTLNPTLVDQIDNNFWDRALNTEAHTVESTHNRPSSLTAGVQTSECSDLDQDSPNLSDDLQLYHAECSQSRVNSISSLSSDPTFSSPTFQLSNSVDDVELSIVPSNTAEVQILNNSEKVNILDGALECKRGTVWCKPFELLTKEDKGEIKDELREDSSLVNFEVQSGKDSRKRKIEDDEENIIVIGDSPVRKQKLVWVDFKTSVNSKGGKTNLKYLCGKSKCQAEMASLSNWKRHMRDKHNLTPSSKLYETLINNERSENSTAIDPFDLEIPIDERQYPWWFFPCSVFGCEFVGKTRNDLLVHMRRHKLKGTKREQKFKPVVVKDCMMSDYEQVPVVCSIQCITTMGNYRNSSLEELRWDDYQSSVPTFALCTEGIALISALKKASRGKDGGCSLDMG